MLRFTITFQKLCQKHSRKFRRKISRKIWQKDYRKLLRNLFWKPCTAWKLEIGPINYALDLPSFLTYMVFKKDYKIIFDNLFVKLFKKISTRFSRKFLTKVVKHNSKSHGKGHLTMILTYPHFWRTWFSKKFTKIVWIIF